MSKKTYQKHEIVRPHALNGCTLYPLDKDGRIDVDLWRKQNAIEFKHLRGFEPLVIEDGVIIEGMDSHTISLWKDVQFVRVNYCGTVYGARTSSLSRITRKRNA